MRLNQVILKENDRFLKQEFKKEEELENLFGEYYRQIVSEKSFWTPLKKKLKSRKFKNFNHSIGDGFLLVWDNPTTPTLYITEVELERHDISRHILPQLGNFISFIQSASLTELNEVRDFLYTELKSDKTLFAKIAKDSGKEVHELLDNAMEDLQILLVIDKVTAELSIGLTQIEKAINVKIRKIEVSKFTNKKGETVILFSDSDSIENTEEKETSTDGYSIEYHLKGKSEKVAQIVSEILAYAREKEVKISPKKFYIGFHKGKSMIFSCVARKNSVIVYSKAPIEDTKTDTLPIRDVRKIGHYTGQLPTEIVLKEVEQIENLKHYLDEVLQKYALGGKNGNASKHKRQDNK